MWYIIYPGGKKDEIDILKLESNYYNEIYDYSRASREEFRSQSNAIDYAIKLAKMNDKRYVGPTNISSHNSERHYLD